MLFSLLDEYCHELRLEPTRETVFRKLYPEQSYDDQQLRLLSSYLLKVLEDWLEWRYWKKEEHKQSPHLLSAYLDLGLEKHFIRQLSHQRKRHLRGSLRHPEHYWTTFQLERAAYEFESAVAGSRGRLFNLQEQEDALQIAFISMKLRQACYAVAHQQVYKANYHQAMLPEILALASEAPYRDIPAISVYYHGYHAYVAPDSDDAFQEFNRVFFQHFEHFPQKEARDLLLMGINFCIRRINQEGKAYLAEALELYRKGLENNLLLDDGWLRPFTVNNIIGIALRLKELDWVKAFLQEYRNQLEPRRREAIIALNTARIAYIEGDYRSALRLLHQADDRDFIHQMTAKTLQLKIYYENGDFELLGAHIKNTRAFLRRRKNLGYHERIYLNIFSLTEQLYKMNPYDPQEKAGLRLKIESTDPLTEKDWLLKAVDGR